MFLQGVFEYARDEHFNPNYQSNGTKRKTDVLFPTQFKLRLKLLFSHFDEINCTQKFQCKSFKQK